jgi:F1F0 ATPase subunit 2
MIEQILTACALFAGILIGLLFFGGLWWTVQKVTSSRQPALLFAGSFLLRTLFTLAAFYRIGNGSWQRLLVCLIGFMIGRILVRRFSQVPLKADRVLLKEGVR